MEKTKLKQIEAKLFRLLAQFNQNSNQKVSSPRTGGDITVIRRRKGNPDVHIAREAEDLC